MAMLLKMLRHHGGFLMILDTDIHNFYEHLAVSYTHLDVYKRQVCSQAARCKGMESTRVPSRSKTRP